MATKTIEIRAKYNSGTTTVNALITHPMESGHRINSKTGDTIPPHFIQKVTCRYKETVLLAAQWGIGMPMNQVHILSSHCDTCSTWRNYSHTIRRN